MNLWYGYRDLLPPDLRAAHRGRTCGRFKYWFTDPQPAGVVDQRYYWSENHRLLFHADEYLAGQAFPNDTFTNDGNTGAWHQERARGFISDWLDEKARFGFTEWHSDVYYQKTLDALLTVVEWVDDPVLSRRASMVLDLLLFDIALHVQKGNNGATHGRSYMKDKSVATDQDIFNLAKLLFDDTTLPYTSTGDPGAALLARAEKYRVPAVILRVATVQAHDHRPRAHGGPARRGRAGRPDPDGHRRLLLLRSDERRVLVGTRRADRLADRPAHAGHPRRHRPLGIRLLQAVQAARRHRGRRPAGGPEPVAGARTA